MKRSAEETGSPDTWREVVRADENEHDLKHENAGGVIFSGEVPVSFYGIYRFITGKIKDNFIVWRRSNRP